MGGMARALLRNPRVCKVLGCRGVSWGASLEKKEVPWIWDHRGQRLELKGEASPLCVELDWVARWVPGAHHRLCAVSPVGTSGLSPSRGSPAEPQ